jgi:hypothetical protein
MTMRGFVKDATMAVEIDEFGMEVKDELCHK